MIGNKKVLAVIPARGGSKGLPRKNILSFCGKPLIAWTIEQALQTPEIDKVIVSTDSQEIADVAVAYGASVPFLRPDHLASDIASSIDVLLHAADFLSSNLHERYDYLICLEPTSPLREVSDISGSLKVLNENDEVDSVVGVARTEGIHPAFLYKISDRKNLVPYLEKHPNSVRRQELEVLYHLEGSVYISDINSLREKRGFYHERTAPWIVDRYKSIEIDEYSDFIQAEALMKARLEGKI